MAKKPAKPKNQEFSNNPFRDLKGLSVSGDPEPKKKQPEPPPAAARPEPPPLNDADLFAAEMAQLGVAKKTGDDRPDRAIPDPAVPAPRPKAPPQPPTPKTPEDEFRAAVGQLDVSFADDFPEPEEETGLPQAAARRMRQLRRGQLVPEDQLDLHGLFREPALEKVRWFLEDAVFHGRRTVLIVTGRGQHSADGPVLREAVAKLLREEEGGRVLEWGVAPKNYGGDGALVVFLRGS